MSYCWPEWVSPHTWEGVSYYMPVVKRDGTREVTRQVLVAGSVVGSDLIFRRWFWVRERDVDPDRGSQTGPYTIELRDATNGVLASLEFAVDESYQDEERAAGQFRVWVPYPDGVASIAVVYDGEDIGERAVSPSAPTVTASPPA